MERKIFEKLEIWQKDSDRKPLILKGARQVGKTWIMKEFGKRCYENFVYFNFDESMDLNTIFQTSKEPRRTIELLSMISGQKIVPGKTLIILDEIQECPEALNSLKYFNEEAGEYHIIAAGSLLGTLLATPKSYPVGMVNILEVGPLSFEEYLKAADEGVYDYYQSIAADDTILEAFFSKMNDEYNNYLIVGGMPECVNSWLKYKDVGRVLKTQRELIELYEHDISKHSGSLNSGRILMVFRSLVSQLTKSNEKFMYGAVRKSARARDFEEAIEWLVSAGLILRVYNVSKIEHPLAAYEKLDHFKLYFFDTGLLKCMAEVDNAAILLDTDYQFKGPLTENYVLQQFKSQYEVLPRYYSIPNMEIDFLLQEKTEIIPIEVKGGHNKSAKSFKNYIGKYNPKVAIRFSKMNFAHDGSITNIPLVLVGKTKIHTL